MCALDPWSRLRDLGLTSSHSPEELISSVAAHLGRRIVLHVTTARIGHAEVRGAYVVTDTYDLLIIGASLPLTERTQEIAHQLVHRLGDRHEQCAPAALP
jgi:hypothetical protein